MPNVLLKSGLSPVMPAATDADVFSTDDGSRFF